MIIPKNPKLTVYQLAEIKRIVEEFGCKIQLIEGAVQSIYAILGDERHELLINRIEGLDYIDRVDTIQSPHKLLDIRSELKNNKTVFGGYSSASVFWLEPAPARSIRKIRTAFTRQRKLSKRRALMLSWEASGSRTPIRIRIKGMIKS